MVQTASDTQNVHIFRNPGDEGSITQFLNRLAPGKPYEIFPLAGDASSRRYYRVVIGEQSRVLMAWEPFSNSSEFPFLSVQHLLLNSGVHVPEVISFDEELGIIYLEDLGDLTLERKFWENQDQSLSLPFYKLTIDELIKTHFVTQKFSTSDSCSAFKVRFDVEKLMWEMNYAIDHLLLNFCHLDMPPRVLTELKSQLHSLCETLADEPTVVCHRDYHSRNVMLKLGKIRIIDFQDARLGPIQYDLVSLLKDSYVDLDADIQAQLLAYYMDQRHEHVRTPLKLDEFMRIFELQSIQRCFKACGSFSSFFNARKDTRYLKYLPKTIAEVHSSLTATEHVPTLKKLIEDEGLLTRKFDHQ